MACRCISPPNPVRRTTIGCARFSSALYFRKRYCWQIEDMTPTGSGRSSASKARGHTSPPKRNRKEPTCFSPHPYRARNFERFFNKIKQCRRIATRYDKLAANYLAFVKLASIGVWLRAYESASAPFFTSVKERGNTRIRSVSKRRREIDFNTYPVTYPGEESIKSARIWLTIFLWPT